MRGRHKAKRSAKPAAAIDSDAQGVKEAKPVGNIKTPGPIRMLKRIIADPNFGYQCMVILLTLTQDNMRMDRRIERMTSSVDTIRNVAGVVNNAMQSLKVAADAPNQIRKLVRPEG